MADGADRGRIERGEIHFSLVLIGALVAGLIAAVPFMLMGRQQVENADRALDVVDSAQGVQARAALDQAMRASQTYFAENGSYEGLTPQTLQEYGIAGATSGPAAPGQVSLRGVSATSVVLVSADGGGGYMCAAANGTTVVWGSQDAATAADCTG